MKVQGPAASVKFLGVQWLGVRQDSPSPVKEIAASSLSYHSEENRVPGPLSGFRDNTLLWEALQKVQAAGHAALHLAPTAWQTLGCGKCQNREQRKMLHRAYDKSQWGSHKASLPPATAD